VTLTNEQLGKLVVCAHGTHQVDTNEPGLGPGGSPATTCPDDPGYNPEFAAEVGRRNWVFRGRERRAELARLRAQAQGWELLARFYELKLLGLWGGFERQHRAELDMLLRALDG
jgi:hypothetical protein